MLLKRDTRSTIGWVGLIWFSPGIGAALYAIFGVNRIRGEDGRISRVRYVLPRHKAANWVGPGTRANVHATGGQWRRRALAV